MPVVAVVVHIPLAVGRPEVPVAALVPVLVGLRVLLAALLLFLIAAQVVGVVATKQQAATVVQAL